MISSYHGKLENVRPSVKPRNLDHGKVARVDMVDCNNEWDNFARLRAARVTLGHVHSEANCNVFVHTKSP